MKNNTICNLEYWKGDLKVEVIEQSKPFVICRWKRDCIKNTTHTDGELIIKPVNLKEKEKICSNT